MVEGIKFQDRTLICKDCSKEFIFTAKDQEFFAQKGFENPIRCKQCRITRRNKHSNYNRDINRQMYEIICDKCGKKAQVPFRPVQGKPVYCKSCYQSIGH